MSRRTCFGVVLMYVCWTLVVSKSIRSGVQSRLLPAAAIVLLFILLPIRVAPAAAAGASDDTTNSFINQPLSRAEALNLALRQSPNILRAQKDVAAAQGVIIQTRAIAIPKARLSGNYSAVEPSDVDRPQNVPGFNFGTEQSWTTQMRLTQSIYEGGRLVSSFRAARLNREQSMLNYQTAVADTLLDVRIAYDDVLLAEQQITVQEASVELLVRELSDTTNRFEAGTVPRFNVLRAEVELANAKPKLIRARNSYRIAKNNLVNKLGWKVPPKIFEDIPLQLTDKLEAVPYSLELPRAISLALERRTEIQALRKAEALRKEDIVNARAGYKPSLQAFAGYDAHSSLFSSDLTHQVHGWITGVELNWDIFDGLRTQGKVKETTALFEKAGVELDDASRRIELEVRTAFSNFIESRELLESQGKVVEEAEEAVRLARSRNEAGTGTQLDVLSAQTALTEAHTTQVQALHDFSVTRARLERAIGETNIGAP